MRFWHKRSQISFTIENACTVSLIILEISNMRLDSVIFNYDTSYVYPRSFQFSSHSNPHPISRANTTTWLEGEKSQMGRHRDLSSREPRSKLDGFVGNRMRDEAAEIRTIAVVPVCDHAGALCPSGALVGYQRVDSRRIHSSGKSGGVTNRRRTTVRRVVACGRRASRLGRNFGGGACRIEHEGWMHEHEGRERARNTDTVAETRHDKSRHLEHVATTLDRT